MSEHPWLVQLNQQGYRLTDAAPGRGRDHGAKQARPDPH